MIDLLLFLLMGATAGWLAGRFMNKGSGSVLKNIVVGIVGGVLGVFLFALLGLSATGIVGSLVTATVGAVTLLAIASWLSK